MKQKFLGGDEYYTLGQIYRIYSLLNDRHMITKFGHYKFGEYGFHILNRGEKTKKTMYLPLQGDTITHVSNPLVKAFYDVEETQ